MHLFIVGIAMEIGIEPTVRHGADLGYIPVVAKGACGFGHRDAAERSTASLECAGECFPCERRNNLCPVSTHTIATGRGLAVIERTLDRDSRLRWLRRGSPYLASPSASRAPTGRHTQNVMCRTPHERQQSPYCRQSRNQGLCASISSCLRFAAARSLGLGGRVSGAAKVCSSHSISAIVRSASIPSHYPTWAW